MKYKKGDKVKIIKDLNRDDLTGKVGTIIVDDDDYFDYGVEFDEKIGGYSCSGKGKDGYCRWFDEDELELVEEKEVIHCPTKQEFKEVLEYLESVGGRWRSGRIPTKGISNWDTYKEEACLNISNLKNLEYTSKSYYKKENYSIITAQQYLEKKKKSHIVLQPAKVSESLFWTNSMSVLLNNEAPELHKKSGSIMQKLTAKIIRTFSKDEKELYKAGYVDENNKPTSVLKDMMLEDILEAYYKENKKVYVELAKEINKEK